MIFAGWTTHTTVLCVRMCMREQCLLVCACVLNAHRSICVYGERIFNVLCVCNNSKPCVHEACVWMTVCKWRSVCVYLCRMCVILLSVCTLGGVFVFVCVHDIYIAQGFCKLACRSMCVCVCTCLCVNVGGGYFTNV